MDPEAVRNVERVPHGGTVDPELLDFSANTNPARPSGLTAVYDAVLAASRRYPSDDYSDFRAAAADYVGCDPLDVIPTAGGMDAIRLAVCVTVGAGDSVLVPQPSFGEYVREVRLQGGTPVPTAHDDLLDRDPSEFALVVVCNPNNPTGETYSTSDLLAYAADCREAGTALLVDEAFLDFTGRTSLASEPGVVVARSLTKMFGLPGLRAGFAVATGDLNDRLDAARLPWGLSWPAAEVGTYCLGQTAFVEETRARVDHERERMRMALTPAYDVWPSESPFLLVDAGDRDVDALLDYARNRSILLRDARTFPGLDSHVRVAVKRHRENDRLLDALLGFDV